KTEREKFNAVVEDIIERNTRGQPALVGTVSIEKSEQLSKLLKKRGVRHEVLNAKYHEREAEIVAQAGREGAVTIETNMAGRRLELSSVYGSYRLYQSHDDNLLRSFVSHRIQKIKERLGIEEGEPIEHKLVTRAIATAQKRVETHNYEIRKHLLEYDDVMNKQREIIYGMRRQILEGESQAETIAEWIEDFVAGTLDGYAAEGAHPEDWDLGGLGEALFRSFDVRIPAARFGEAVSREGLAELVVAAVRERYAERERELGADLMRALERHEMLVVMDTQ